jgi:hypothetical protein
MRLGNHDNGAFAWLGRYNAALLKQTAQMHFLLNKFARGNILKMRDLTAAL